MCHKIEKSAHGGSSIEHSLVHVHIDDVCPALNLRSRNTNRVLELAFFNETGKFARTCDVGAFTDHDERIFFAEHQRFVSSELGHSLELGLLAGNESLHCFANRFDVGRSTSAATADDVDPTLFCKVANEARHLIGCFIELAKFIWESGIRITTDCGVRDVCKTLEIRTHFVPPQTTV